MGRASTAYKRLFVRNLGYSTENGTLCDQLKLLVKASVTSTSSGKVLTATASNGHSHSWTIPEEFSPQQAAELVSEIVDRKEEAEAKLIADGNATPTDAQIITEMLDKLRPIRSVGQDYTGLRTGRTEVTS